MRIKFANIFLITLLGIMAACTDKDIDITQPDDTPDESVTEYEGYSLSFKVDLDAVSGTRADDDIDNYIDTKNKFRVLFFDSNGNFIFEAIDRTVNPVTSTVTDGESNTSTTKKSWYVHIPMNYIVDRSGHIFDAEAVRNQLRDNNFKVAILANWKGGMSGAPQWDYNNSILCTTSGKSVRNINDLHHLEADDQYGKTDNGHSGSNGKDRPTSRDTYGFLMEEGNTNMGVRVDWVNSNFSATSARDHIRNTVGAAQTAKINGKEYGTLWYLWNFMAAKNKSADRLRLENNDGAKEDVDEKIADKWIERNHYDGSPLNKFMNTNDNNFPTVVLNDDKDDANLSFINEDFPTKAAERVDVDDRADKSRYGVRIFNQNNGEVKMEGGTMKNNTPYGFKMTINSTGTLSVICRSSNGNETQIALYNSRTKKSDNIAKTSSTTPVTLTGSVSITGDPETYYLYCDKGTAIDILQIEYICDQYLYETDRDVILPDESNPIPMYGVQNFTAIGTDWQDGSSYNISDKNNHNGKNIYLIRSLAKVELYIPDYTGIEGSMGKPSFVYMRSCNRHSRCEPMDVETPTDEAWNNLLTDGAFSHDPQHCEWFKIREHGYCYTGTTGDSETSTSTSYESLYLKPYQTWLSWFYGSWASTKWLNGGKDGWSFDDIDTGPTSDDDKNDYPHIFNPRINRSDYALMAYEDMGAFHKFVMYMPDRNIDDPNYPGMTESLPKIAHIEFRYKTVANLNDNDCYRIYFTNYTDDMREKIGAIAKDKFEDNFEKDKNVLKNLFPIMRNHVYQFYMTGSNSDMVIPEFDVKVTDWGGTPVTYVDW